MPKRILIIGLLFCLGGVMAIWEVVTDLFSSHININLAVFLLPVGIGLLKGKARSRWWAGFWFVLGYLLCAVMVFLAIFSPENAYATWFGYELRGSRAIPYVLLVALFLAVLLVAMHKLLYSEKADGWFEKDDDPGLEG